MNMWKKPALTSPNAPGARDLSWREIEAVGGGDGVTGGVAGHRPTKPPIVYVPIVLPFPNRRLPG